MKSFVIENNLYLGPLIIIDRVDNYLVCGIKIVEPLYSNLKGGWYVVYKQRSLTPLRREETLPLYIMKFFSLNSVAILLRLTTLI